MELFRFSFRGVVLSKLLKSLSYEIVIKLFTYCKGAILTRHHSYFHSVQMLLLHGRNLRQQMAESNIYVLRDKGLAIE
jgi:hypothetical protein